MLLDRALADHVGMLLVASRRLRSLAEGARVSYEAEFGGKGTKAVNVKRL